MITCVGNSVGVEVVGNQTMVAVGVLVWVGVTVASKKYSGVAVVVQAPRNIKYRNASSIDQFWRKIPNNNCTPYGIRE